MDDQYGEIENIIVECIRTQNVDALDKVLSRIKKAAEGIDYPPMGVWIHFKQGDKKYCFYCQASDMVLVER